MNFKDSIKLALKNVHKLKSNIGNYNNNDIYNLIRMNIDKYNFIRKNFGYTTIWNLTFTNLLGIYLIKEKHRLFAKEAQFVQNSSQNNEKINIIDIGCGECNTIKNLVWVILINLLI